MKITDYPQATELASDDSFIIDGPTNGTRHIPKENLPWGEGGSGSVPATDPVWVSHRNTYRGKSLGTYFTNEQKQAIKNGTFDDFYIGDYWTISGFDWLIADINYWLGTTNKTSTSSSSGDDPITINHLVIVPKTCLYDAKFNDSGGVSGGYIGSNIYKTGLSNAKNIINNAFGESYILSHKERLINSTNTTNGLTSSSTWVDSKIELMNQIMVFGSGIFDQTNGTSSTSFHTIDTTQLSLFRLNRNNINNAGNGYWLRDIVSPNFVVNVTIGGAADDNVTTNLYGVRPVFGLTGGE